jgi:hypothetical protein
MKLFCELYSRSLNVAEFRKRFNLFRLDIFFEIVKRKFWWYFCVILESIKYKLVVFFSVYFAFKQDPILSINTTNNVHVGGSKINLLFNIYYMFRPSRPFPGLPLSTTKKSLRQRYVSFVTKHNHKTDPAFFMERFYYCLYLREIAAYNGLVSILHTLDW